MNIILGSGIIGLLAKHILGPSWKIVPFHKSRFFSFNPALDDNFVICDQNLHQFIKDITKEIGQPTTYAYHRGWSIRGEILKTYHADLCRDWLHKLFGDKVPPQAEAYMTDRMHLQVYNVRVNQLYYSLIHTYMEELRAESQLGLPTQIGHNFIVRNGVKEEYERMVSTIPLDVLCKLMNIELQLPTKTLHYVHLETSELNFEGMNQLLIVDREFDFFKATNVSHNRYLLYFHNEINNPGIYLMNFIQRFEILDGTSLEGAIPMGPMPKLDNLDAMGVFCVGSHAQHDWCMDVGSCVLRLLRYAERGYHPSTMQTYDGSDKTVIRV